MDFFGKNRGSVGLWIACIVFITILAGCSSIPKKPVELRNMGDASGGLIEVPKWMQYVADTTPLQNGKEYADVYIFVVTTQGKNLGAVQLWLDRASAPNQLAGLIATRVENVAKGNQKLSEGLDGPIEQALNESLDVVRSAEFTGFRNTGKWWNEMRTFGKKNKEGYEDLFYGYLLFVIDKKQLQNQIANEIKKIQLSDNRADMKPFYDRLIQSIISSDLGYDLAALEG